MVGFVCELTPKCNLRCGFCYNPWRSPHVHQPTPLSPTAFADILIPALRGSHAQWLAFAGGEPLLYPGLKPLMRQISDALPQVKIGLLSNGLLLSAERLSTLVSCGLSYVELSLFASSGSRYQSLTGSDRLDQAHAAILAVKQQGLPLTVACTLLADGLDEFEDIVLTAMAFGADAFAMNPFTPTGHGLSQQDVFNLTQSQLIQYLTLADHLAAQMPMPVTVTLPVEDCVIPHRHYPHLHFSRCQCAQEKWVVDPQGYLRTCEQNQISIGNLAKHSFAELSVKPDVTHFLSQHRKPECIHCERFSCCGGGCRFRKT